MATSEDSPDQLVGRRFHNTSIDESFTVVGQRGMLLLFQYDDGTPWDEGGVEADTYEPLDSWGPTLAEACADGQHEFSPRPSDLGIDTMEEWTSRKNDEFVSSTYLNTVRCKTCGLSGSVLSQFLGHETPTVCYRCDDDVMPSEESVTFSPNPNWTDAYLCEACADEVTDAYEPFEVDCHQCDTHLGTNEENSYIQVGSPIEQRVSTNDGAVYEDGDIIFVCDECREAALEDTRE